MMNNVAKQLNAKSFLQKKTAPELSEAVRIKNI